MARRDRKTTHGNRWRQPLYRASRPRRYPRRIREMAEVQMLIRTLPAAAEWAGKVARGFRDLSAAIDRAINSVNRSGGPKP